MEKEKYQNGKIYKIINSEMPGLVYYGSTIQTLEQRMEKHNCPSNPTSSKPLFAWGIPEIVLLEEYPCFSRKELNRREGEYQLGNQCINKAIAGRTHSESDKNWHDANKSTHHKSVTCPCGGTYSPNSKSTHFKRNIHIKYLEELTIPEATISSN